MSCAASAPLAITVVSLRAGVSPCAKTWLLEALALPFEILGVADVKPVAVRFLCQRWKHVLAKSHVYEANNVYLHESGHCHLHNAMCPVAKTAVDIAVAGLPCKAFSALRVKNGTSAKTKDVTSHPAFATVNGEFEEYLRVRTPGSFFVEEVLAFANADVSLGGQSHMQAWASRIAALGYNIRVLKFPLSLWVKVATGHVSRC